MNDLTVPDWLLVQLRAIRATIVAYWDAAVSIAAPTLKTARAWIAVHLEATADRMGAAIHAGSEVLRPCVAAVFAAVAPRPGRAAAQPAAEEGPTSRPN